MVTGRGHRGRTSKLTKKFLLYEETSPPSMYTIRVVCDGCYLKSLKETLGSPKINHLKIDKKVPAI